MSLFRRREPPLPKAAVCFSSPAMTRYAADWLKDLGGCKTLGVLSDDCADVVWQCESEQADLLLLETDFTDGVEDKDVSARCDIAIEVRRKLPDCRVYLICEDGHPEKLAALEKAAELMKETDRTLESISFLVGYDDYHYFSRVFRKKMGISPSEYRSKK